MFRFAFLTILIFGLVTLLVAALIRLLFYKEPRYLFSYVSLALSKGIPSKSWRKKAILFLRFFSLLMLVFLMARPQLVDSHSQIHVEGVDMVIALDVSGSMQCFDDVKDQRSRITIAKKEALDFIEKRENDPIGLVIFGMQAVSRCPLTLDKKMLRDIINSIELGVIDAQGTALAVGMLTAANRLKNSTAKSKVIILLTDGEPTPEIDIDPEEALKVVKKLGIKVYTIGIGGEYGGLVNHPLLGIRQMGISLNKPLLEHIAKETGGHFFEAKNAADMKRIYETIDRLEKTEYDATVFTKYEDIYKPLLVISIMTLLVELLISTFVWFAL